MYENDLSRKGFHSESAQGMIAFLPIPCLAYRVVLLEIAFSFFYSGRERAFYILKGSYKILLLALILALFVVYSES